MTGGVGALPFFIDFMKDFLQRQAEGGFSEPPNMPEDMKELFRQRQRELAAERAEYADEPRKSRRRNHNAGEHTEPKDGTVTMPPPPKADEAPASAPKFRNRKTEDRTTPPPAATRPREVDTQKKKGKKGDGDP